VIINRRTYHNVPGKFRELLAIVKQIKDVTRRELGKEIRVTSALFGPLATIVLEMEHEDTEEEARFAKAWYALMFGERNLGDQLFQLVESAKNELWIVHE
jgi:hypothetical protein